MRGSQLTTSGFLGRVEIIARASDKVSLAVMGCVWGVWAVMLLTLLVVIAVYGRNVPLAEDWLMVAPLTGRESDLLGWLWQPNNGHRLPIPRLLHLGLLHASGGDFRAGMFFNSLAAVTAAAVLIRASKVSRGRLALSDAIFPLLLLHLGHWINLVWSWQIQFVTSVVIFCAVLGGTVAAQGAPFSIKRAVWFGSGLVSLALCGANGLLLALPLTIWLGYEGTRQLRSAELSMHRGGFVLLSFVAATLGVIALVLVAHEKPEWSPSSPSFAVTAEASLKFMGMAFGPGARTSWSLSVALAVGAITLAGLALGRELWRAGVAKRRKEFALLWLISSVGLLCIAIGWGRGGLLSTEGMPDRYALLAVPGLCVAYFAYGTVSWPAVARWGQRALLAAVLWFMPSNYFIGFWVGEWYRDGMDVFLLDVAAGEPIPSLAEKHRPFLLHWNESQLQEGLLLLQEAGHFPFDREVQSD